MWKIRQSEDRGHFNHGWLDTYHTFSFGDYYDQNFMGFRNLRVLNEDWVQPGKGFPTHHHQDMEIVTFVLEGALEHRDSLGNGSIIRPGDLQRMSAGTGIDHSEFNHSSSELVHLLQIWFLPDQSCEEPGYQQIPMKKNSAQNDWQLIFSPNQQEGILQLHSSVDGYYCQLQQGQKISFQPKRSGNAWLQIAEGEIQIESKVLKSGDGLALTNSLEIGIEAKQETKILAFDLN